MSIYAIMYIYWAFMPVYHVLKTRPDYDDNENCYDEYGEYEYNDCNDVDYGDD